MSYTSLTVKIWIKNRRSHPIFGIRLFAACVQQTAYVPDEFYQSTDVIHNFVLNETDVTWEWKYPIRTSIWMFPMALLARALHLVDLYRYVNLELLIRYGQIKNLNINFVCMYYILCKLQNCKFAKCQKYQWCSKISILVKKSQFWSKISILVKNINFGQ